MKTDLFQSCGHCWVFQICWHIECSTFTASFFRIWNSLIGIPPPPLALFVVMLSKAHLTSHSTCLQFFLFLHVHMVQSQQIESISFPLNLVGHGLLRPVECSGSDAVWLLSLGFTRHGSFHFFPLEILPCKEVLTVLVEGSLEERPWVRRSQAEESHSAPTNSQQLRPNMRVRLTWLF